jgi:ferric-dicitrate binding protein FerR (iron transport regulator)
MPYKNPEHKRQWEREHREQRNAMRREQRLAARSGQHSIPKPMSEPNPDQKAQNPWKAIIGLAVGFGVLLLAVLGVPKRGG